MLQQLCQKTNVNLGGLFINPEFISELIPISYMLGKEKVFATQIIMNNGHFYNVPFVVADITDKIIDYFRLIGKFPTPKTYTGPR
jgi:hypothetical protein